MPETTATDHKCRPKVYQSRVSNKLSLRRNQVSRSRLSPSFERQVKSFIQQLRLSYSYK